MKFAGHFPFSILHLTSFIAESSAQEMTDDNCNLENGKCLFVISCLRRYCNRDCDCVVAAGAMAMSITGAVIFPTSVAAPDARYIE